MNLSLSTFPNEWNEFLKEEKNLPYFKELLNSLDSYYKTEEITPKIDKVYYALSLINPKDVKVIILGQDPYPTLNVANGLAFSVSKNTPIPQSLKNIYKELNIEYGYKIPQTNGDLTNWAKQGVLLLNTSLTTIVGKPNSMKKIGWQTFTNHLIEKLSSLNDHKRVYLLFGNEAIKKENLLNKENSLIIKCVHPSPLSASRGFFNSNCFKKVNELLKESNLKEIDWQIEDDQINLF